MDILGGHYSAYQTGKQFQLEPYSGSAPSCQSVQVTCTPCALCLSTQGDYWHDPSSSRWERERELLGHSSGPKVFPGLTCNISRQYDAEFGGGGEKSKQLIILSDEGLRLWQTLIAAHPKAIPVFLSSIILIPPKWTCPAPRRWHCWSKAGTSHSFMPTPSPWGLLWNAGSGAIGLEWVGLRPCSSNRLPSDVDVFLLRPHLE